MSELKNNASASRYELMTDGHLSVADYRREEGKLYITHVEVPSELRGRGIAAKVMEGVVNDAKAQHLTIVPICSYAATYMQRLEGKNGGKE